MQAQPESTDKTNLSYGSSPKTDTDEDNPSPLDDEAFHDFFRVQPEWSPVVPGIDRSPGQQTTLAHRLVVEAAARHDAEIEAEALKSELHNLRSKRHSRSRKPIDGADSIHRRGVSNSSRKAPSSSLKHRQPRGAMTTGRRSRPMSRVEAASKERQDAAEAHLKAAKVEYVS